MNWSGSSHSTHMASNGLSSKRVFVTCTSCTDTPISTRSLGFFLAVSSACQRTDKNQLLERSHLGTCSCVTRASVSKW